MAFQPAHYSRYVNTPRHAGRIDIEILQIGIVPGHASLDSIKSRPVRRRNYSQLKDRDTYRNLVISEENGGRKVRRASESRQRAKRGKKERKKKEKKRKERRGRESWFLRSAYDGHTNTGGLRSEHIFARSNSRPCISCNHVRSCTYVQRVR